MGQEALLQNQGKKHLRRRHLLNFTISVGYGVGASPALLLSGLHPSLAPTQNPMLRVGEAVPSSASHQCRGMTQVFIRCMAGAQGQRLEDLGVEARGGHSLR